MIQKIKPRINFIQKNYFRKKSNAKLTAGIFDGLQIRALTKNFSSTEVLMIGIENV